MKKVVIYFLFLLFVGTFCFSQNGKIPFDFPVQEQIQSLKGDFVLCPSDNWIKDAFTKGAKMVTFIYYGGKMSEPARYESKILTLSNRSMTIPNAMIIPIKSGGKAKPGDIILTHWQSGSGMQRAIVVGGTETEPIVRYLDLDYENPSGIGKKDDKCKVNTFHKILKEYEPGTSVAVKTGKDYVHWQVINISGNKILAIGFAGKMDVFDKSNTKPIPIKFIPKEGETVFIPNVVNKYSKGVVKKLDKKIGRVWVEIDWAGKKETRASAYGQIISNLP